MIISALLKASGLSLSIQFTEHIITSLTWPYLTTHTLIRAYLIRTCAYETPQQMSGVFRLCAPKTQLQNYCDSHRNHFKIGICGPLGMHIPTKHFPISVRPPLCSTTSVYILESEHNSFHQATVTSRAAEVRKCR